MAEPTIPTTTILPLHRSPERERLERKARIGARPSARQSRPDSGGFERIRAEGRARE